MTTVEQTGGDVIEARSGKPWVLVGGGAAALVLIGGGAWAAMNYLGGGGDQPDSVLPDTAAAYARIDLDPSAGQKVAAVRFFQGLDPEMQERLDAGEWREWAWEKLEEEGDIPDGLSYEDDIEPWLGDRAGIALIPNGDADPIVAVALQVKDGEAALEALDKMTADSDDEFGYYLESDYVVFTQSATLDEVKAAAEAGTLNDLETYSSDMDDLGDPGILSFWVDAERLPDFEGINPTTDLTGMSVGLDDTQDLATGRYAGTVRLTPDAIELHGIGRDVEGLAAPSGNTARVLDTLPADTAVALSLENGSELIQAVWDQYSESNPDEIAEAVRAAEEQGFELPGDIQTLVGQSLALGVGPNIVDAVNSISGTESGMPQLPIVYRAQTDAVAAQQLLVDFGMASVVAQRTDDDILTVGLDQAYIDGIAAGNGDTLGDSSIFKAAVPGADDATMIFYANVNPFEQYYLSEVEDDKARTALEKLAAVGFSAGLDSATDNHFTIRFVADEE